MKLAHHWHHVGVSLCIAGKAYGGECDIGQIMSDGYRTPASLQFAPAASAISDTRSDYAVCARGEEHLCSLAQWAVLSLDGGRG